MIQPYQYLTLNIEDVGAEGEGIAHEEGYTVFVPNSLPGEIVRAQAVTVNHRKNLVYARFIKAEVRSPIRVSPACDVYGVCGGCNYMHAEYAAELEFKKNNIAALFMKNAGIKPEIADIVPSDPVLGYRNKAQIPFAEENGKVVLGFYRARTRRVKPITDCPLHGKWLKPLIAAVTRWANENKLTSYSHETGKGVLRHLVARSLGGVLAVTIVINGDTIPDTERLKNDIEKISSRYTFGISVNKERVARIMGAKYVPLYSTASEINIDGVKLALDPLSFFQVNDYIRKKIYDKIFELVSPDKDTLFIDLYAGIGLTGIKMAEAGAEVINVEIVPEAVMDADKLYATNGLKDKATNIAGDAKDVLPRLSEKTAGKRTVIYVDPPRKGLSPEVVDSLNACAAEKDIRLIYLSCNPATLTRDIKLLSAYAVSAPVMPFDMFPRTANTETLVELRLRRL